MSLWRKNGGVPTTLPFSDYGENGSVYTNLAREPSSRLLLGWAPAPDKPAPNVGYEVLWSTQTNAWIQSALPAPPDPETGDLPAEIPMHQARKALRMRGPLGLVVQNTDVSWFELVETAIAALPSKVQRGAIQDELDTAPNMVLAGATTQALKGAIGMSNLELDIVARLALTLP